jgi:hypothetical protein
MVKRVLLAVLIVLATAGLVLAQDAKFLQLSVFNPMQMVPEDQSIEGVSLDLFYTLNKDVTGFSFSLLGVNGVTGDGIGVQWGLGNWVEGFFHGWQAGTGMRFVGFQDGWVNITKGDFTGLQLGLVNWTEGFMHGVQAGAVNISKSRSVGVNLGLVNYAEDSFQGFQWGAFNYAAQMHGLQLGLVNWTKSLDGLQIGLANYNGNKKPLEFMVFVNWSF